MSHEAPWPRKLYRRGAEGLKKKNGNGVSLFILHISACAAHKGRGWCYSIVLEGLCKGPGRPATVLI